MAQPPILTGSTHLRKPAAKAFKTGTLVNALNKMTTFYGGISACGIAANATNATKKGFG